MHGGTLYVTATPIGNLDDITYRALATLRGVDFIAAEDTRVTGKLLSRFEIDTPMVAYHAHNYVSSGEKILQRLKDGESCAVVTDAGMPCISDPGEELVRRCHELGIAVNAVPGACAAVSALAVSGLPTGRFTFVGFLSVSGGSRRETLKSVRDREETLIFYEAPHKLRRTLSDFCEYFPARKIALCRELTKIYEEVVVGTAEEVYEKYKEDSVSVKGEFVIIVEGRKPETVQPDIDAAFEYAETLVSGGMKKTSAAKSAAEKYGVNRQKLYEFLTH